MRKTNILILLALVFIFGGIISCGTSTDSSDEGSSDNGSGSGSGDNGSNSTGFEVSGTLSSLNVSSLVSGKNAVSGSVTHVMAVNASTGDVSCKSTAVESDGSFNITLTEELPWFLFFFDQTKSGQEMFMGRFISETLDTLTPSSATGSTDLGTVSINGTTEEATSDKQYNDLLSDLGITSTIADFIGSLDNIVRRYANPDMDGNGNVDCDNSSSSNNFILDFHVRFNMLLNGVNAKVTDLIDGFLDTSVTTADYQGTGIYVAYLNSFSSAETGTVTFADSAVTTSEGGLIPANTATSAVTENSFGGYNGFGPNTTSTSELPTGEIIFQFGEKTLTFSDVQTPSLQELNAPTGRIFPFIKFNRTDSSCSSNCTLSGISYKWMKKTSNGWELASLDEIDLIVSESSPMLSFWMNNDSGKIVGFNIPKSSVEGSVTWLTANANLAGVSESEFSNLITTQICHVGLSYDDKMGMRYFENIDDQASCSP